MRFALHSLTGVSGWESRQKSMKLGPPWERSDQHCAMPSWYERTRAGDDAGGIFQHKIEKEIPAVSDQGFQGFNLVGFQDDVRGDVIESERIVGTEEGRPSS